jgi:hypothetical protein
MENKVRVGRSRVNCQRLCRRAAGAIVRTTIPVSKALPAWPRRFSGDLLALAKVVHSKGGRDAFVPGFIDPA